MPTSIIASAAASSAISSPIRSSTNTAPSISARSPAACGCSGPNRWRASSTGRSPRRCSRSITCCWRRCWTASLQPFRELLSAQGAEGLIEQAVRVMRWGLWMAPIINTFLRQSPDPSWYNQDGAVRSLVAIGADISLPNADFRNFSLTMFLGLLAYDWLRVIIWFDHMGLRVATPRQPLVPRRRPRRRGGGALPRPWRAHPRDPRRHPPLRHLGAAADPVLHPARRRMGQGLDRRRGALARRRPCPGRCKVLALAYARRRRRHRGGAAYFHRRTVAQAGTARRRRRSTGRPRRSPRARSFAFNNGAVGVEIWRDGRGAATVMADGARRLSRSTSSAGRSIRCSRAVISSI